MQGMTNTPRTYEAVPSRRLAFIGLGVMGYPMAGHLALAGHHITVYNRNPAKAKELAKASSDFLALFDLE